MTEAGSGKIEEEFIEAKKNWELERLYVDLASAKGKALTPVEKKLLRGLLCGFGPAEIANIVYKSGNSSTVRVYLSNGLYKYIEEMLSNQAGYPVKVKNWSRVTHLLEEADYKKSRLQIEEVNSQIKTNIEKETDLNTMKSSQRKDWGEAVDVSLFHGRKTELAQVQGWIVEEHCRLVVILGMGGIGKTAFSIKLAEQIKDKFEYVIWRSLRLAPPLEVILSQLIPILSQLPETKSTETVESRISQLIDCLRSSRCLIVLDNIDAILCSDSADGSNFPETVQEDTGKFSLSASSSGYVLSQIRYRQGYEAYGELLRRIGDSQHQSCLLITSREKPQEITTLEGETLPVRTFKLTGLRNTDSMEILKSKGFTNLREEECKLITNWYSGNPLFIKLVATAIQELFGGNFSEFLAQGTMVFGDIRVILDQQFNRLSSLEKLMMSWLALNPGLVSVRKLQKEVFPMISERLILEAVELLQRRSLIERQASSFFQNPVWMEYLAYRFIEENFQLSQDKCGSVSMSHTIFAAQLKNYITAIRLI
ncbi:MAG: NB-ARC domain-containing protein [Stigonema ocellatum SAG 48.90 = DSM 106950]|nr:NB-ARC domain-containing protein [Stigonema ocellatum SAG 48.90 = DSM 106950]